jgi:hypothetical protein
MCTCSLCGGYFKISTKMDFSSMDVCNDCSVSTPDVQGQYDAEIEFELNLIRNAGRVLPVFDNDDFGHGY